MSFTGAQRPELNAYLAMAWQEHCRQGGLAAETRCMKGTRCGECVYCRWYEDVLFAATGKRSTTQCNAGRHYEFFMRELEAIHQQSIKWHMKAASGDARRILHDVQQLCREHDVDEDYMRRIAAQKLSLAELPPLDQLSDQQIVTIHIAVKQHVTRTMVRRAEHDPQKSRKTRKAKPQQVRMYGSAVAVEEPDWTV